MPRTTWRSTLLAAAIAGCAHEPAPVPTTTPACTDLARLRLDTRTRAEAQEHRAAFAGYEQLVACGDTTARAGAYMEACHLHDVAGAKQLYAELRAQPDPRIAALRQICLAQGVDPEVM